jgi:hypothetical protein
MFEYIRNLLVRLFTGYSDFQPIQYGEVVQDSSTEDKVEMVTEKELMSMNKLDLDKFAEDNYGIKLDRRRTKQDMVNEFFQKLNETSGVS